MGEFFQEAGDVPISRDARGYPFVFFGNVLALVRKFPRFSEMRPAVGAWKAGA